MPDPQAHPLDQVFASNPLDDIFANKPSVDSRGWLEKARDLSFQSLLPEVPGYGNTESTIGNMQPGNILSSLNKVMHHPLDEIHRLSRDFVAQDLRPMSSVAGLAGFAGLLHSSNLNEGGSNFGGGSNSGDPEVLPKDYPVPEAPKQLTAAKPLDIPDGANVPFASDANTLNKRSAIPLGPTSTGN